VELGEKLLLFLLVCISADETFKECFGITNNKFQNKLVVVNKKQKRSN
jgi:hypothetical protein